jgi:hypothetical protein
LNSLQSIDDFIRYDPSVIAKGVESLGVIQANPNIRDFLGRRNSSMVTTDIHAFAVKVFLPEILHKYTRVLYMDSDIFFNEPISTLWARFDEHGEAVRLNAAPQVDQLTPMQKASNNRACARHGVRGEAHGLLSDASSALAVGTPGVARSVGFFS